MKIRNGWKVGTRLRVFSNSEKKWFIGIIESITQGNNLCFDELLVVYSDGTSEKELPRHHEDIQPLKGGHKNKVQFESSRGKLKKKSFLAPTESVDKDADQTFSMTLNVQSEDLSTTLDPAEKKENRYVYHFDTQKTTCSYQKGNIVEIYSNSQKDWYKGYVETIKKEKDDYWLTVVFGDGEFEKDVLSSSNKVRSLS